MPRRTVAALFAAAALAGTTGALAAPVRGDDLIACRNKGQIVARKDGWLEIKAPPVVSGTEGERTIVDYAAPPNTPKVLYATNGDVIKSSVDGGCDWFRVELTPSVTGARTRIRLETPNAGCVLPQ